MCHPRMTIAIIVVSLAFICQFTFVSGCQAGSDTTTNELLSRTSPTRSGGSPAHYQPTGLLGDIVATSRKRPASPQQHEHTPTGLLGDIVHQGTKRPATSSVQPGQSSHFHTGTLSQSSTHLPLSSHGYLTHPGSIAQSKDAGALTPGTGHLQGQDGPSRGAESHVGRPDKTPATNSASQPSQRKSPWWNQAGGRPRAPKGTGARYEQRYEQRKAYVARKKAEAQGSSSPQKPSNQPKRRASHISE
ncbi:unnamed protein product [Sympodiomycopsis kandeliae]